MPYKPKTSLIIKALLFICVIVLAVIYSPLASWTIRSNIEKYHGVKLPLSTRNCQLKRMDFFLGLGLGDRGVVSMFEIDSNEVDTFIRQLKIRSHTLPAKAGDGDPCWNGHNVWPPSSTFVPGNPELEGVKKTWRGNAKPIEMLSCDSATGDWLHVEIWEADGHGLLKIYTDWN